MRSRAAGGAGRASSPAPPPTPQWRVTHRPVSGCRSVCTAGSAGTTAPRGPRDVSAAGASSVCEHGQGARPSAQGCGNGLDDAAWEELLATRGCDDHVTRGKSQETELGGRAASGDPLSRGRARSQHQARPRLMAPLVTWGRGPCSLSCVSCAVCDGPGCVTVTHWFRRTAASGPRPPCAAQATGSGRSPEPPGGTRTETGGSVGRVGASLHPERRRGHTAAVPALPSGGSDAGEKAAPPTPLL